MQDRKCPQICRVSLPRRGLSLRQEELSPLKIEPFAFCWTPPLREAVFYGIKPLHRVSIVYCDISLKNLKWWALPDQLLDLDIFKLGMLD